MLNVITDIPGYRHKRYPGHGMLSTWTDSGPVGLTNIEFHDLINSYRKQFKQLGFLRGRHICILANAGDAHLLAAEFACLHIGCILVPIHANLPGDDIQAILSQVRPAWILAIRRDYLESLSLLEHSGETLLLDRNPIAAGEMTHTSACRPDDQAMIIYTSGAMGQPKGVVLSHRNLVSSVLSVLAVTPVTYRHTVLSYLPSGHIFERVAMYCYLASGCSIHFADSRQAMALLRKIRPHYMTAVPRILERAISRFRNAGAAKNYFVRSVVFWALDLEEASHRAIRSIIRRIILTRLRTTFGGRLSGLLVGGAALNPVTERLFLDAGIRLRIGYGLSESSGVATLNRFEPGGNRPGTVGQAVPGVQIRIDGEEGSSIGEIMLKSDGIMQGYFNRPAETAAVLTEDGWLRTGDRGELMQSGFLRIAGRLREHFKNAYGEYVSPIKVEQLLESDDLISRVMVIGSGKEYTAALIVPDFEALQVWCAVNKVHWTAPIYMIYNTIILDQFQANISKLNTNLSAHEHVKVFRLVAEPWSVENGMLTPALKLRRNAIEQAHIKLINEMYAAGFGGS